MMPQRWVQLLFAALLLSSACGSSKTPSSPSSPSPIPEPNATIFYTAVGASDALGIGSTVECFPFVNCPNGKGYVQEAVRQLRSKGFTVNLNNFGIPTAVIGRDFQNLGLQYGREIAANVIDAEAPFVPANSTLVTIFAGGNDVNTVTSALGQGVGGSDQNAYINMQVRAFGDDYATLLRIIRERAPTARIVALNLPNMAAMPFLATASLQRRQAAQKLSVGMTTTVVNPLTAQGVVVIDLMCDPRSQQASIYSGDGFHPNDTGYAWLAGEVVAAATTSYRSPQTSCSAMVVVPN
jgi:lysophospholipase L1-like esterase